MAATGSPSHPPQQDDDDKHLQNQGPNPTESQEAEKPPPQQPPHSETIETSDDTNPLQSPIVHLNSQQSDKGKDRTSIPESETIHSTRPEPIILTDDANNTSQPPLTSPVNTQRRLNKPKKPASRIQKRKKSTKKVQDLIGIINPIPFIPKKTLDFSKHEDVLIRLGLYNFSKIELDHSIRSDLLVSLIVNYDAKKRCSYVNGFRINVNRADLARALKLPGPKSEKVSSGIEEVDLDSEVFSDDAIVFIEDFVLNWMLLHEDSWDMPIEISNWIRFIKDGHPEKMDSASLIWYMVEKELTQARRLVNCYYASHLQYLIRSQRDSLFEEEKVEKYVIAEDVEEIAKAEDEREEKYVVADNVEEIAKAEDEREEKYVVADNVEEIAKAEDESEEKYVVADNVEEIAKAEDEREEKYAVADNVEENVKVEEDKGEKDVVAGNGEEIMKAEEEKEQKEEKQDKQEEEEKDEKAEKEEKVSVVHEHDIELNLGPEVEELLHEEVKEDDEVMVEADEHKEEEDEVEEQGGWLVDGKNDFGHHFMQRCQSSDMNNYEERRPEEVEDEQIEQVEDEEEEEEEEEGGERGEEGFDMEANDDDLDRDGLTGNFIQGVEAHIPFGSQVELHRMSSMDLFGTRDASFMPHGGPSFFGNGGKRVMETEEDIHQLDRNSKRLKTDEMWDQKPSDFGMCFDQIQQTLDHMRMMLASKEQSFENSQYNQQLAMNQLQERQNYMDLLLKSKDEELQRKDAEVFRLERELYLMGDLVAGYRKALHDTRDKFAEYRKRNALHEEPLYKDAGPGGLVLSTKELEKLRLKQEEDNARLQMLAQSLEEEYAYKFQMCEDKVLMMVDKLVSFENEVKKLKEISTQRKETWKPRDEQELSAQPEENKKSLVEQNLPAEPEENEMPLDEPNLSTEPEEIQKSLDEQNLPAEPEKNQMPLHEPNLCTGPEASQKSLDELNVPADPEENQMPLDEPNLSSEPKASEKSPDEQDLPAKPEANQKSPSEQELSAEPGASLSSHNEVSQNDVATERVPSDAESEEI